MKKFSLAVCGFLVCIGIVVTTGSASDLHFPHERGYIKSSFDGAGDRTVYFIQDAHCNPEAQQKVFSIISYLVESRDVKLIAMEGAESVIDTGWFRQFPYEQSKHVVAEYFLNNGYINGAEYFALVDDRDVRLTGIEDRSLYCANFGHLCETLGQSDLSESLEPLRGRLLTAAQRLYPARLWQLVECSESFAAGRISLADYIPALVTYAKETGCYDASSSIQLESFLNLLAMEQRMNAHQIRSQQDALSKQIISCMDQRKVADFLKMQLKFNVNKLSHRSYLDYLIQTAGVYAIGLEPYGQLRDYALYLHAKEKLERGDIMGEVSLLFEECFTASNPSAEVAVIHEWLSYTALLANACRLQLSARSWASFSQHTNLLADKQSRDNLCRIDPVFEQLIPDNTCCADTLAAINGFYSCAKDRDKVLIDNTLKAMESAGAADVIILAGGFHADGMLHRLREHSVSYREIGVRLERHFSHNLYRSMIQGHGSYLENLVAGTPMSLAVSSWLEQNPLVEPQRHETFGNMFKSLLLATISWQMSQQNVRTFDQITTPLLRDIRTKVNDVARTMKYDIFVREISRVENRLFVRIAFDQTELVYGLFTEPPAELSELSPNVVSNEQVLEHYRLFGGSAYAMTVADYKSIIEVANRKGLAEGPGVTYMARSMLASPYAEHVIKVLALLKLNGKNEQDLPEIIEQIAKNLENIGVSETPEAVGEYIGTLLTDLRNDNKLHRNTQGVIKLDTALYAAAQIAFSAIGNTEGKFVSIPLPESDLMTRQGLIKFLFLNSAVPLSVTETFIGMIHKDIEPGTHPVASVGDADYIAHIEPFSYQKDTMFAFLTTRSAPVAFYNNDIFYRNLLGSDTVDVRRIDQIGTMLYDVPGARKSLTVLSVDGSNDIQEIVGPTVSLDFDNPQTLDEAIKTIYLWFEQHGIEPHRFIINNFQHSYGDIFTLFHAIFGQPQSFGDEFQQIEEFRKVVGSFIYADEHDMEYSCDILADTIADIITGEDQRYYLIPDLLTRNITIDNIRLLPSEEEHIYKAYLLHLENTPGAKIDERLLATVLDEARHGDEPLSTHSFKIRLLDYIDSLNGSAGSHLQSPTPREIFKEIFPFAPDIYESITLFEEYTRLYENPVLSIPGIGDTRHTADIDALLAHAQAKPVDKSTINAVKNHFRLISLQLAIAAKKHDMPTRIRLECASKLFSRVYSMLHQNPRMLQTVNSPDHSPALYLKDHTEYVFIAKRRNILYISEDFMGRISFLTEYGQVGKAVGMLAQAISFALKDEIMDSQLPNMFEPAVIEDVRKGFSAFLAPPAPLIDIDRPAQPLIAQELELLVDAAVNRGTTDPREVPIFRYPSDIPELSQTLRVRLLSGQISAYRFIAVVLGHFFSIRGTGAPIEMVYNNSHYRPGDVIGYIREFPQLRGENKLETFNAVNSRIIDSSITDPLAKLKAREVCQMILRDHFSSYSIEAMAFHEFEDMMYDIIRIITGDDNPYMTLKDEFNRKGIEALAGMDDVIAASDNPLKASVLVSIMGNALDFADMKSASHLSKAGFAFVDEVKKVLAPDQIVAVDHFDILLDQLSRKHGQTIVYCTDNAGEIATDMPLIKRLIAMGHTIVLVTRDKHTINDVSYADAIDLFSNPVVRAFFTNKKGVCLLDDGRFRITHSGSNITGTDLRRATPEFIRTWLQADIRILKGQGNYETMRYAPFRQDMFFLVKIKDPLSALNRHKRGDVLIEFKYPNPLIDRYMENEDLEAVFDFAELDQVDDRVMHNFIQFYIDYISKKSVEWSIIGDRDKIAHLFSQARMFFSEIEKHPHINAFLIKEIRRKLTEDTIEDFFRHVMEPKVITVNHVQTQVSQQFIVIDYDSVPKGNLTFAGDILRSLEQKRSAAENRVVRYVLYSDTELEKDIVRTLLSSGFYRPSFLVFGKMRLQALRKQTGDDSIESIECVRSLLDEKYAGAVASPSSIKVVTDNPHTARYAASESMVTIQLPKQADILSSIQAFISSLVSLDALMFGGTLPNMNVVNIENGEIISLSQMRGNGIGSINSFDLNGTILQLKNELTLHDDLERIRAETILQSSI